jgi:uncharacterized membrane protein YhhN
MNGYFVFLVLFFIVILIEMYGEYKDNYDLIIAFKPLAMPVLVLFYIFAASLDNLDWFIIVAFLCGGVGDFFLMLKNEEKWFLYGMIAFLLNQIFFIISFLLPIKDITAFESWALFLFGPVALTLIFTVPKFIKKTGDLKIPVLVYMVAILIMHISALLRLAQFTGLAFTFIYMGSIFFIFSDSFLALNKWDGESKQKRMINLSTYFLAQFYIALGAVFTSFL